MHAAVGRGGVVAARAEEQVAGIYQVAVLVEEEGIPRARAVGIQVAIDCHLVKLEGILTLADSAVLIGLDIPFACDRCRIIGAPLFFIS